MATTYPAARTSIEVRTLKEITKPQGAWAGPQPYFPLIYKLFDLADRWFGNGGHLGWYLGGVKDRHRAHLN